MAHLEEEITEKSKHKNHGKLQRMTSVSSNTESDDELYREIFFIDNGSQSNIYCNTIIRYPTKTQERFLVGTLKGKVSCFERHEDVYAKEKFHSSHSMQARDVYFSYIPGNAEIISIDAFYQHSSSDDYNLLIVGVTIIIEERNGNNLHFLNIYNSIEPTIEFDIDKLAQVLCQHLPLNFIPYQLSHADIYVDGKPEAVFLLAGSDQQIHVYRSDEKQTFVEEFSCSKLFPEFADIPGLVIWMRIKNCEDNKRFSAVGCDNGSLVLSVTNFKTSKIEKSWSLCMDGPISQVRFFTFNKAHDVGRGTLCRGEYLNLLVTSCIEVSVVFMDIEESGLDNMAVLDQSDQFDSVTCSCVADIDFDGRNEIILGTFGQEIMIYKWCAPEDELSDSVRFDLIWTRSFSKPILSIHGLDLMNDGMQELVIVSLTGVHILQQNINTAAEQLLEKIVKAFPDQQSVVKYNDVLGFKRRVTFTYGSSDDDAEDGGNDDHQDGGSDKHQDGGDHQDRYNDRSIHGVHVELNDGKNDELREGGSEMTENLADEGYEKFEAEVFAEPQDGGSDDLESIIDALCSTKNSYNDIT